MCTVHNAWKILSKSEKNVQLQISILKSSEMRYPHRDFTHFWRRHRNPRDFILGTCWSYSMLHLSHHIFWSIWHLLTETNFQCFHFGCNFFYIYNSNKCSFFDHLRAQRLRTHDKNWALSTKRFDCSMNIV